MPWTTLDAAETIALVYSHGLYDVAGRPLIEHNKRVTAAVELMLEADEAGFALRRPTRYLQAAMLHNVFEDTVLQPQDLLYTEVPPLVVQCLELLTRHPGETSGEAIARLIESGDRGALMIKFCDLRDHVATHEHAMLDRHRCAPVEYTQALQQVRAALRGGWTEAGLAPPGRVPAAMYSVHS